MKITTITTLAFILIAFTSCDVLQYVHGTVIDAETRLPIENVAVRNMDVDEITHTTDSLGNFEFARMTGCIFRPPRISFSFEKEGYQKVIKKYRFSNDDATIPCFEHFLVVFFITHWYSVL